MEYSTHVFLQKIPVTEQTFEARLQDIADQITTTGCINPNVFAPFTHLAVQQAVVSSRHIAFLLEDGRICRLAFRIQADKIESNPVESTKTKSKHLSRSHSRQSLHRPNFENLVLSSTSINPSVSTATANPNPNGTIDFPPGYPLSRQRHHVIRTARGRTGIILGSRPLIPASNVPEELIEQVQMVLQGKSRNMVLRELQRTNLDVNMAVNNLLARDDDGDNDLEDEYVGADLISLLDVNPHNEHSGIILESEFFDDPEFALRYSSIQRRVVSARIASSTADPALERDRKRNRYDPRWLDGSLREELFGRIDRDLKPDDLSLVKDSNTSIRKSQMTPQYQHQHSAPAALTNSSSSSPSPILFGDQLQFWTDIDNTYLHFTHLACLHSELIAINTSGQLCQWNWQDDYPYQDLENPQIKHPKTFALKLFHERIIHLSANLIRATVLTESNRLATWMDDSLSTQVNLKLQHSLQEFPSVHILDIQTSPLYTVFRTDTNELYWYGLLPHKPRKKLLERLKDKTRHKHRANSQQQIITIGCSVCLISNPYYNQGAWAFSIRDGQPKLGQLMEQVWILSNTARFRIKSFEFLPTKAKDDDKSSLEMPPPPSPASSTCSVDSNPNFSTTLKRKKPSSTPTNPFLPTTNDSDSNEQHSKIKDEEYWPLEEVVFIEDCKVAPIGKVMKIDGLLVLVQFPSKNIEMNGDPTNLENCRILRKDDLQVVKGNQIPKTPDCTLPLANAKRITLESGTLLTYSVDKDYLHTLQLRDSTVYYVMYEVGSNNGSCRSIRQNPLPLVNNRQALSSFLGGHTNSLRLNPLDIPRVVIDGNQLLYPLVSNQDNTNFKDPQWKNLLGINYFSQGIIPINSTKTHLTLNILQMKKGLLIPHILRYDIERIRSILNEIESTQNHDLFKLILDERMDGGRNLFHACIHIAIPLSNKEYVMNEEQNANEKRISFAMDLLQSQSNTDHNYGNATRMEQPINTWPPMTNDSAVSNEVESTTSFYRNGTMTNTNPGSVSPSYIPTTLSSKIQYLQNQVFQQQQINHSATSASSQPSQFGPILSSVPITRPTVNHFTVWPPCKLDEREKRLRAMKILRLLLDCPLFQDHLISLLSSRNLEGQTPFMSAINSRAYPSASLLLEYALKLSRHESPALLRMIYPSSSNTSDYSPLYTLCTNDTCSFTWTGEEHISQAIFECKTCGLSGTLCCCSECAQTCHKGHDCRLKRTSPTAYCDCWEICKCKSLIAGDQQKRLELLKFLINETNLVEMKNSRHENILLYLVQTVGRQVVEQQQFGRTSTAAMLQQQARKTREQLATVTGSKKLINTNETESNIPDHHLEPPQFCRRALEIILADWNGVKSMLLCGCPDEFDPAAINLKPPTFESSTNPSLMSIYNNENLFSIDEQQQTSQLDRFTYLLLAKCNTCKPTNDLLDILLHTLTREMSNPTNRSLARYVTARFVRSIVRLFTIVNLQSLPDKSSQTIKSSSSSTSSQAILSQCKRVFQRLTMLSIDALVHMADLLLAPVRHGIAKPTAMFNFLSTNNDILQSLDEVFNIDSEYSRAYQRDSTDAVETELEEDDNHSDNQSQPDINNHERQPTTTTTTSGRETVGTSLSDNESEMELELLAESDSDNESNHSAQNTNTHRTSATAGSENMALFSEDDNSESDDADSVRSDSVLGEGDDTSQTEAMMFDEARDALAAAAAVSTTTTASATAIDRLAATPSTNNNAPTAANAQTATSHITIPRLPTRTAMTNSIFGDSQPRRHNLAPVTATASSITQPSSSQPVQQQTTTISVNTTNSLLARAFGILIRQITDLLVRSPSSSIDSTHINEKTTIETTENEIEECLLPSWRWFATVMDSVESQIRFGMALSNLVHHENDTTLHGNRFLKNLIDRAQTETKKKTTTNRTSNTPSNDKPINNRLDTLNYSLSLMRSMDEHGDQEPLLDVLSYKHLAYLLDGFIYYFRENGLKEISSTNKPTPWKETNDEDSIETETITSNNTFFQRSSSTLCLSSLGPDPFQISIDDSLPLACRPQLLQPICRKEDLFGRFLYNQTAARYSQLPSHLGLSNRQRSIPDFLQPNYLNLFNQTNKEGVAVNVLLDLSAGLITPNNNQSTSILLNGSYEYLLARWRFSIELFVKLFLDDVGNEPGSIINESSGFSAREQRFRHDMERLKNAQQKDIRFEAMERDRVSLIQKTFRTLNTYFYRNQNMSASSSSIPPLAVQRVKVTFKDEPGEGSGVARSFYASIAEAVLSEEKLPVLELGAYGASSASTSSSSSHPQRQSRSSRDRRATLATYLRSDRRSAAIPLSSEARPFRPNIPSSTEPTSEPSIIEHWTPGKIKIGLIIYPKIAAIQPVHAEKITGMFLEGLPTAHLHRIINVEEELKIKIDEAMSMLTAQNEIPPMIIERFVNNKQLNEYIPLFWQPDKKGVYAPRPGKHTPERLTAYRNIGRLIGLCLLQNELFPLPLCRHVIKYILYRPIRWHDLAFFDCMMYENLRRTAFDAEKYGPQYINDLHLTFSMTVSEKEGGETYDLLPDGSSKDVNSSNLYEFIKRYSEFRMLHLVEQSLQHLRFGVFDVLPSTALDYLSPEDFRLLLNGTSNINVTTLMTYTTFNDESGETSERTNHFKKWFWSVLEKFDPIERQDLVYFWTGSPALPASEAGFQPQPSVTIRPADDQHFPTANTCISRLYVPLYSSKAILKSKLQYAIKTKMFGFV